MCYPARAGETSPSWSGTAGRRGAFGGEARRRAGAPEAASGRPRLLGRVEQLAGVAAALAPEEVRRRESALDETEIDEVFAGTDVAQEPAEAVDAVELRVGLEPDRRAGHEQAAKRVPRLVGEALTLVAFRGIELEEAHLPAVGQLDGVAVDDGGDACVLLGGVAAAGRERDGGEAGEEGDAAGDRTSLRNAARRDRADANVRPVTYGRPPLEQDDEQDDQEDQSQQSSADVHGSPPRRLQGLTGRSYPVCGRPTRDRACQRAVQSSGASSRAVPPSTISTGTLYTASSSAISSTEQAGRQTPCSAARTLQRAVGTYTACG